jgi:hypothetical protein
LASSWTKSLMCKDAINKDFTIQKCSQVRRIQSPCQPSGRSCHPVRTLICPLFHSSGRQTDQASSVWMTWNSVQTLHWVEKFLSSLHPSGRLSSPSRHLSILDQLQILSKFKYGKTDSTVRTMWYPIRTRISLRQESQFKCHRSDVHSTVKEIADSTSTVRTSVSFGPDDCIADMEIACWSSAVWTTVSHCPDAALKQERFSAKFSEKPVT